MSSVRVRPVAVMSAAVTEVTGLIEVKFALLIRDPVTTTSSNAGAADSDEGGGAVCA